MPTIAPIDAGAHVEWAGFLGGVPCFAAADGSILSAGSEAKRLSLPGGVAVAEQDALTGDLLIGGENGAITSIDARFVAETIHEPNGKWVNALACGPSGVIAWANGKSGFFRLADGNVRSFVCERTIEAIAFAPKGLRVAIARYNGVELRFVNTESPPQFLEWKGAHVGVTFSPDGRFLVTTMQENALHGWRLADSRNMRMTGYPSKVRSMSWSPRGKWLASSGAPAAIVWPFTGKDGPMGKSPKELGTMGEVMVTRVACHPVEDVVAIGYQNGMILAVRIADEKDAVLRRGGAGAISALNWDRSGRRLAFGSEGGEAGTIDIAG
jgi:WD40 repeat protein